MAYPPHPRWGCSVEARALVSDLERADLNPALEHAGIQALQKISRLSSESYTLVQTDLGKEINITILQAAFLLARGPRTIHHLANPPVLKSCIRLMKTVEGLPPTEITPFSHEYGYLCFKLFIVVLNVCLLERWDKLEEVLTLCKDKELAVHVYISDMVAFIVGKQFEALKSGEGCDWVLGWSASANGRRQPTLLPLSDISTLFNLIWDDRKKFLLSQAPFTRKVTGLSGLMFVFSRYIAHERKKNLEWKLLQGKLYEIALRYALVADARQRRATVDVIDANKCTGDWYNTPKHIDTEDSRLILGAYIQTLTRDEEIHETLHPPVLLRLVALSVNDSTQELLPEVVRWTIEYGWRMFLSLDDEEDNFEMFIKFFMSAFSYLLSPPLHPPVRLIPLTQTKVIEVMRKKGLLDWIARALIQLRPGTTYAESEANGDVHESLILFGKSLTEVVPQRELERCFGQYVPEWWKVHRYFASIPAGRSSDHRDHYEHCGHAWLKVAELLGLEPAIDEYASENYYNGEAARSSGARFGCTGCIHTWYCDDRCKRMDWRLVHPHIHSHDESAPALRDLLSGFGHGF
ncbi:unnamed protein product [Rhizoctonia solani]|uniref:Uncharacterized protein n=1 Tax=Rhizoctonia solani TaxID=456999 RepID=A0A8H3H317_9AGAM|nr:unnamed protein product [Rhizoctonia solani]